MRFDKSTNGREGGLGAAGGDMREDEMEEEVVGSLPVRWKARSFCRRGFGDSEASGSLRIRQSPVSSCEKIEDSSEMDADRYADSLCTSLSIDEREGGGWEGGSEPPEEDFFPSSPSEEFGTGEPGAAPPPAGSLSRGRPIAQLAPPTVHVICAPKSLCKLSEVSLSHLPHATYLTLSLRL